MPQGCGIDAVDLPSMLRTLQLGGQRFLDRVYTPREQEEANGQPRSLATIFAIKEAVSKALGTGIRGVRLPDLEVVNEGDMPSVLLRGQAARRWGGDLRSWLVATVQSHDVSIALVIVLEKRLSLERSV